MGFIWQHSDCRCYALLLPHLQQPAHVLPVFMRVLLGYRLGGRFSPDIHGTA